MKEAAELIAEIATGLECSPPREPEELSWADGYENNPAVRQGDRIFIARCSPKNIRLLLDHIETLEAENERLDATCTALDAFAKEQMGLVETLEARVATLSADYDDAVNVIQEIAEQPERHTSPDGSISYSIGYAFHIVKCRAGSFMKGHAAREASR
jgi:hypothetical protein